MKPQTLLMAERDAAAEVAPGDAQRASENPALPADDTGADTGAARRVPAADAARPIHREADPFEHEADLYGPALRSVPLLTREEEEALGRTIRESRLRMTECLAQVPAAAGVFVDFLIEADARERPITDALFAPFESFDGVSGKDAGNDSTGWRDAVESASRLYGEWRASNAASRRSPDSEALRKRLADLMRRIEPGMVALREALHVCKALDERVSDIETERRAFHADILERDGEAQAREALLRIRHEAGVDLTTLRECGRAAASAHARYASARDRMINANLRLAYFMAHRVKGNGLAFEDLVQEAMIGLMRAVDKFDYRKGYKFSTYAVQWIRQTTTRSIAESSRTIRVAAHAHDDIVRLKRIARELEQRLGRDPSTQELADASGFSEAKIEHYSSVARAPMSLDYPAPDVEDSPLSAIIVDPAGQDPGVATHDERLAQSVDALLDTLPAREAFIMRLRFGIGGTQAHTLEEVGRMLGITRERTRQLEARAFEQLRETVRPEWLEGLEE